MSADLLETVLALPDRERLLLFTALTTAERLALADLLEAEAANPWRRFEHDPVGFVTVGLGERVWSKQREILESVRDHKRTAVPACHAPGKALRHGTPVLTPAGWAPIETLRSGDRVIAGDGTPTTVTGVYPQGARPLYRVTFNDGSTIDADADHQWVTVVRRGARRGQREVVTTAQMLTRSGPRPTGWARPRIPTVLPVDLAERAVPLDPYVTGLLLGDGWTNGGSTPRLSTADPEIIEAVRAAGIRTRHYGRYDYALLGIAPQARAAGVVGRSETKRVHPDYLWNRTAVRLAVLQGVMDTDGTVRSASGDLTFTSTSRGLVEDVVFLVRSLGGQTRPVTSRIAHSQGGEGQRSWRVSLTMPTCPFRLPRKAQQWREMTDRRRVCTDRLVVSIEKVEPGEATCIAVDHPSRTYVTKDFVVTHNTHIAARIVGWWIAVHPPGTARVVTTASGFKQVRNILWPHIRKLRDRHNLPGVVLTTEWKVAGDIAAYGFAAHDYDETAVQGQHAPHLLVVVDEAGGISPILGRALEALMTGGHTRLLVLGNPPTDAEGTWFERVCTESELYNVIRIGAFDTPNFTGEDAGTCTSCPAEVGAHPVAEHLIDGTYVEDIRGEFGEDSAWWTARILAQFPRAVANKTIPLGWVEMAVDNDEPDPGWAIRLGVDVASDGGDEVVVARADGWIARIVHTSSGEANANAVDVAGQILPHIQAACADQVAAARRNAVVVGSADWRPVRVKIDSLGLGWGVAGLLAKWGEEGRHDAQIVEVKVSETAGNADKFENQRAEMWWTMRTLLQPQPRRGALPHQQVALALDPRTERRTMAQLAGPTYKHSSTGRLQIEKKAEMKKRGLPSPDRAEAIMLALYEPPAKGQVPAVAPFGLGGANQWRT
ncbi:MAG: LAGLIDADG family homing endonuclease [Actinomycetota bacterium]